MFNRGEPSIPRIMRTLGKAGVKTAEIDHRHRVIVISNQEWRNLEDFFGQGVENGDDLAELVPIESVPVKLATHGVKCINLQTYRVITKEDFDTAFTDKKVLDIA